jgi:hypothetical protein
MEIRIVDTNTESKVDTKLVKKDMVVLCSEKSECAVVDANDSGTAFRVNKDSAGVHHDVPFAWVTSVAGNKIHLDRPAQRVKTEWKTTI